MLPASNRGAGMSMGFPDVCNTPSPAGPIPVPYPNIAMNAQASGFATSVKLSMMNALNLTTQIPMTSGDEAGSAHPTVKGAARYAAGSPNVYVEGIPAITLTSPGNANNMNCGMNVVAVPSVVNVFFSFAGAGPQAEEVERRRSALEAVPDLERRDRAITVKIDFFSHGLATRIQRAVGDSGAECLVLDLRGCPGGAFEGFVDLASELFTKGTELVTVVEADGDKTVVRSRGGSLEHIALTLLVDDGTASAAELLAAAVKAHERGTLLGSRTHGKDWGERLTLHGPERVRYTAPNGLPLSHGIEPDGPI